MHHLPYHTRQKRHKNNASKLTATLTCILLVPSLGKPDRNFFLIMGDSGWRTGDSRPEKATALNEDFHALETAERHRRGEELPRGKDAVAMQLDIPLLDCD